MARRAGRPRAWPVCGWWPACRGQRGEVPRQRCRRRRLPPRSRAASPPWISQRAIESGSVRGISRLAAQQPIPGETLVRPERLDQLPVLRPVQAVGAGRAQVPAALARRPLAGKDGTLRRRPRTYPPSSPFTPSSWSTWNAVGSSRHSGPDRPSMAGPCPGADGSYRLAARRWASCLALTLA